MRVTAIQTQTDRTKDRSVRRTKKVTSGLDDAKTQPDLSPFVQSGDRRLVMECTSLDLKAESSDLTIMRCAALQS